MSTSLGAPRLFWVSWLVRGHAALPAAELITPCGRAEEGGQCPLVSPGVTGASIVPVLALMPVLLWVGVVCLRFRQLHQTSSLAVGVMEESYRDNLECTDEDITDKVRAPSLLPQPGHRD